VLVVATTNFPEALDEALIDRADLVVRLTLPDADARAAIVAGALRRLAAAWPGLAELADDESLHRAVADATAGWDGRQLSKLPLRALAADPTRVADRAELHAGHLLAAVGAVGEGVW
jgi:SpoVK/Ycf46/Vps4 family AAA+-type ATPase